MWGCQLLRGATLGSQLLFDSQPCPLTPGPPAHPRTAGVQRVVAENIVHGLRCLLLLQITPRGSSTASSPDASSSLTSCPDRPSKIRSNFYSLLSPASAEDFCCFYVSVFFSSFWITDGEKRRRKQVQVRQRVGASARFSPSISPPAHLSGCPSICPSSHLLFSRERSPISTSLDAQNLLSNSCLSLTEKTE